jgi:hypothetical protein
MDLTKPIQPRWAPYPDASLYSGLSTRLLEQLVKDKLVVSSLVRRPGRVRGVRLIDLRSLDDYIEDGIGAVTDVGQLRQKNGKKGGIL